MVAADKAKGAAITAELKMKDGQRDIAASLKLAGVEGSAKSLVIPQLNADIAMTGPDLPQKSVKIPITGSARADLEKQTANADLNAKFDESTIQAKLGLAKFSPPAYRLRRECRQAESRPLHQAAGEETGLDAERGRQDARPAQQPAPSAQKKDEDTPVDLSALKGLNANGQPAGRRAAGQWPQARQCEGRGACGERPARHRAAFGEPLRGLDAGRAVGAGRRHA